MNAAATRLPELLLALRRRINEEAKQTDLKYALTMQQFETLWLIETTGKKSMEQIAEHLGVRPPSATVMIERMARNGLVRREKSPNDRRIVNIVLSPKTKKELSTIRAHKESALKRIITRLSRQEKTTLERILIKLIKH